MNLAVIRNRSFLPLIVLLMATVSLAAVAQEAVEQETYVRTRGESFSLGGKITIPANEIRRGEIVNIGGDVFVHGEVSGAVIVIGGSVEVTGRIGRELIAVMSDVTLAEGARIRHGIVNVLGDLEDGGADVHGQYVNLDLGIRLPGIGAPLNALAILFFWGKLIKLVLVFVLILLLAALVGDRVQRISDEISVRPVLAIFVGFAFCVLGVPLIFILLLVSVIGIPMLPFAILIFMVLTCLGLAGVFHHVGYRLGRLFGADMSLLGAMLLGFLLCGLIYLIPFFGYVFWTFLTWWGVGLLLLSRMGGSPVLRTSAPAPSSPVAPEDSPVPPLPEAPPSPAPPSPDPPSPNGSEDES